RRRLPLLDHPLSHRRSGRRSQAGQLLHRFLHVGAPLRRALDGGEHRVLARVPTDFVSVAVSVSTHSICPSCLILASMAVATPCALAKASTSSHASSGSRANHVHCRRA